MAEAGLNAAPRGAGAGLCLFERETRLGARAAPRCLFFPSPPSVKCKALNTEHCVLNAECFSIRVAASVSFLSHVPGRCGAARCGAALQS